MSCVALSRDRDVSVVTPSTHLDDDVDGGGGSGSGDGDVHLQTTPLSPQCFICIMYGATVMHVGLDGRSARCWTRATSSAINTAPILNDVSLPAIKSQEMWYGSEAAYTTETKLLDFSKWKITNNLAYSLSLMGWWV